MIYEGRRSSRSNCAFFFERGSRRAENRIFERDARHPFSSNGATRVSNRVSSDLSSQIHHGNAPYPCHPLFLICQRLSPRDYDKIATRIGVRRVVRSLDRSRRTVKRTLLSVIDNERGGDDAFKRVLCPLLFNEDPIRVVMGADLYRS